MKNIDSKLSIVGAGPGDPDLITLKAIKALQSADVVLYDALANEALLDYAPPTSIKIFVGKRAGMHHRQQREINRMIVNYANTCGHVVRLKAVTPMYLAAATRSWNTHKGTGSLLATFQVLVVPLPFPD